MPPLAFLLSTPVLVPLASAQGDPRPLLRAGYTSYQGNGNLDGIELADLDEDGDLDVLASNSLGLVVFRNLGGGVLGPRIDHITNEYVYEISVGDVDGDGHEDVLMPVTGTDRLTLQRGLGDLDFAPHEILLCAGPVQIAELADLDGDGRSDVVALLGTDELDIRWALPGGGFTGSYLLPTGAFPSGLAHADLNGDGLEDLAITNLSDSTVSVYPGTGTTSLGAPATYATDMEPAEPEVADFDLDGRMDLATVNVGADSVSVLFGQPGGTLGARVDHRVTRQPVALRAGDVNSDGAPDLVVCGYSRNALSCLVNRGDGDFHGKVDTQTPNGPKDCALGDLDGDGNLDVAVVNTFAWVVSVHLGLGNGHFGHQREARVGTTPTDLAAADLDGNGTIDLAVANSGSNSVSVLTNPGSGDLASHATLTSGPAPREIEAVDLDGDGIRELIVTHSGASTIGVFRGLGGASYGPLTGFPVGGGTPMGLALGDVNADGFIDALTANQLTDNFSLLLGDGTGGFGAPTVRAAGNEPHGILLHDLDRDGSLDVVVTAHLAGTIAVFRGLGDGNFATRVDHQAGVRPSQLQAADLVGDAELDLVVVDHGDVLGSSMLLYRGLGNTAFAPFVSVDVGGHDPYDVALADFDRDGALDYAVSCSSSPYVSVLNGRRGHVAARRLGFGSGDSPGMLAVADFDADGLPDLAVVNENDGTVALYLDDWRPTGHLRGRDAAPVR